MNHIEVKLTSLDGKQTGRLMKACAISKGIHRCSFDSREAAGSMVAGEAGEIVPMLLDLFACDDDKDRIDLALRLVSECGDVERALRFKMFWGSEE